MKIRGVIDPSFEFSTLWTLPLAESIPKFFGEVILFGNQQEEQEGQAEQETLVEETQEPELSYHIGVVSCCTLFPLLLIPLSNLVDYPPGQSTFVSYAALVLLVLVFTLTVLASAILTLPAILPIAMARGGYEFFRKGGVLDECKTSIASVLQPKSS